MPASPPKLGEGFIFVGEVIIPAYGFAPQKTRHELPVPALFGLQAGYLKVESVTDDLGKSRPTGFRLVAELVAASLTAAEDAFLAAAKTLGEHLNFVVGSPSVPVRLVRIGKRGLAGGLIEQHEYHYRSDHNLFATVELPLYELNRHLRRLNNLETDVRSRAQLAVRWYGMSLSADDPVDKYLSLWIGLESISALISRGVHSKGPKAACPVCKHKAGQKRNHRWAGLTHVIAANAPDMLHSRTVNDLADIRNQIAHGTKSQTEAREAAAELVLDLELCLASGILTLFARSSSGKSHPGTWYAVPSRDYEIRPDLRFSAKFSRELQKIQPYFGQWFALNWEYASMGSEIKKNGQYVWWATVKAEWSGNPLEPTDDLNSEWTAVAFARRGLEIVDRPDLDSGFDPSSTATSMPKQEWRSHDLPPSWKAMLEKAEKKMAELAKKGDST